MALDPHINPDTGVWDDNYFANKNKSFSGGGSDPAAAIQAAIKQMQEANKPAIESLQASIPETQAKYAQTRSQLQASAPSLDERYKNLLADIKGQQTADVNAQTRITSNELGKRGITGSSTVAGQEIQNAISPLNQKYSGLEKETTLAQSDALRALQDSIANLTPQETSDVRAIQNAIAQLQAGGATTGANLGLSIFNAQQQANQFAQSQALKEKEIQTALESAKRTPLASASIGQNSTALYDPFTGRVVNTIKGLQGQAGGW